MLKKMGDTRFSGCFIRCAYTVPDHVRDHRGDMILYYDHAQSVIECIGFRVENLFRRFYRGQNIGIIGVFGNKEIKPAADNHQQQRDTYTQGCV